MHGFSLDQEFMSIPHTSSLLKLIKADIWE